MRGLSVRGADCLVRAEVRRVRARCLQHKFVAQWARSVREERNAIRRNAGQAGRFPARINVEPVETDALLLGAIVVVGPHPFGQGIDLPVCLHPGGPAVKRAEDMLRGPGLAPAPDVLVNPEAIGPVALDCDEAELLLLY